MTYEYDGDLYTLPDELSEISLETIQAWAAAHGHELSLGGIQARAIPEEEIRKLRLTLLFYQELTAAISFFSTPDISVEIIRDNIDTAQIATLLADSGIILAIQGRHMFIPEQILPAPASVDLSGTTYEINSPSAGLILESLTHEEFVTSLTLAGYLLELAEGDWTHFHLLAAAYLRVAGELLSPSLIVEGGVRAEIMRLGLTAVEAAPLTQYFVNHAGEVLSILDAYTLAQLNPPAP